VAAIWFLARPGARAAVRDNLRHVLGREPLRREVVRVFFNGALNYWDTFDMPHLTPRQMIDMVDVIGLEHVERARAGGHGVVCAGAHLGSVALVAQVLPALGHPVIGVIEPFDPPEIFDFFSRARQALGTRLLPAGASAVRELLLALRRNELVGLVTDRDIAGTGPIINFFDAPTRFPSGVAWLSLRTGAPILIGISIRKPGSRFDAIFEPLPEIERTDDPHENLLRLTQAIAERLQYYVAKHPEQWTVFQRRWPEA
jgi:lauroyl/myristoyl acyltransferase